MTTIQELKKERMKLLDKHNELSKKGEMSYILNKRLTELYSESKGRTDALKEIRDLVNSEMSISNLIETLENFLNKELGEEEEKSNFQKEIEDDAKKLNELYNKINEDKK